MPEGWDVLYAAAEQPPILTDERILQIAERHRNHVLTAQSGTKFDVIEHKDVVAFAREIERAVMMHCAVYTPSIYEVFGHKMAEHSLDMEGAAA